MNKKLILGLALAFSCTFFTSCNDDDDMSQSDMKKVLADNETDVYAEGLYGNVKQRDKIYYDNAAWNANALVKNQPTSKDLEKYDKNGYLAESASYSYKNSTYVLEDSMKVTGYDSKGRITEKIYTYYSENFKGYLKEVITYDDVAKRATLIRSTSTNGTTYTEDTKTVVSLRGDGRINYEDPAYVASYDLRSGKATTAETFSWSDEVFGQKDSQGNWTSHYVKETEGNVITIDYCYDATYLYY